MKDCRNNFTQSTAVLLNLSQNEQLIFTLLDNYDTPIELAKHCSIPRPTIYITLDKLTARGLIYKQKHFNKKRWLKNSDEYLERLLKGAGLSLLKNIIKPSEKISVSDNLQISVHKGPKQISELLSGFIKKYPHERMIMISGNEVIDSWNRVLGVKKINAFNRQIKEVGMITELITSQKWFEHQANFFGTEWSKDFEGRSTRVQNIDDKYLDYSSQIFIIKNRVYLVSMEDEVFIEIKNSEIAKLIISLSRFIQDHSSVFDPNALLREIIKKSE